MRRKFIPSGRTLKWFAVAAVFLAVPILGVVLVKKKQFEPPPPFVMPPEVVTSYIAEEMEWDQRERAVGSLKASQGALISAEAPGTIAKLHFESGHLVKKGDLLFELDTSAEQAQLASAQASLGLAEVTLKRAKELRASRSISESELDTALARATEALAEVSRIEANLDKKRVRAPFDGRLGIRQVDVGEFLNPGTGVVSLQTLDPIYVDFSLAQRDLSKAQVGYELQLLVDTYPKRIFEGEVEAIDPDLDEATRMFRIRGSLRNKDGLLKPGMFATVYALQPDSKTVVAVPTTAVYYQAYGNTVFVVKAPDEEGNRAVEQRFVVLGETKGDFVEAISGLQASDEVVASGVFKLNNGRTVVVDNSKALEYSLNPQPSDA